MNLTRYTENGCILIKPTYKKDIPLFMHCAGGMIAVTEDRIESVRDLIKIHMPKSINKIRDDKDPIGWTPFEINND